MNTAMTEPLILDLLAWLSAGPRPYEDVMEAWRTSCPRLTVWEDVVDAGLVERRRDSDRRETMVALTTAGRDRLAESAALSS